MAFTIRFNEEKNELLKATRGISFEDVLKNLQEGKYLADISHPSKKHAYQKIYIVQIHAYAYAIPYVLNKEKKEIFLKTIYPSRVFTKKYMKGGKHEKKK